MLDTIHLGVVNNMDSVNSLFSQLFLQLSPCATPHTAMFHFEMCI